MEKYVPKGEYSADLLAHREAVDKPLPVPVEPSAAAPLPLLPGARVHVGDPSHRHYGAIGVLVRRLVEYGREMVALRLPQRDRDGKVKPRAFVVTSVPVSSVYVVEAAAPAAQAQVPKKSLSLQLLILYRQWLNRLLVKAQRTDVDLTPEDLLFRANKRKIAEQSRRRNRRR